jgi:hypothetical protein
MLGGRRELNDGGQMETDEAGDALDSFRSHAQAFQFLDSGAAVMNRRAERADRAI